jgi:hypothetical protein
MFFTFNGRDDDPFPIAAEGEERKESGADDEEGEESGADDEEGEESGADDEEIDEDDEEPREKISKKKRNTRGSEKSTGGRSKKNRKDELNYENFCRDIFNTGLAGVKHYPEKEKEKFTYRLHAQYHGLLGDLAPKRQFAGIGAGPEPSGVTENVVVKGVGTGRTVYVPFVGDLRVPLGSVVPTPKNPLGTTLTDFMDELEATLEDPTDEKYRVDRETRERARERTANEAEPPARVADGFAALERRLATMPLHAPWEEIRWVVEPNTAETTIDLSVDDRVFDDFTRAFRASRIGSLLKKHDQRSIVTLLLESETEIWAACEGSRTRLPARTWITPKGTAVGGGDLDGPALFETAEGRTIDPRDVAALIDEWASKKNIPLLSARTPAGKAMSRRDRPYLSGTGTLESQMYDFIGSMLGVELLVHEFKRWMRGESDDGSDRRGVLPTDVVDVLSLGGHDGDRRAADALVATALFCGAATSGELALQEMLFQNHRRTVARRGIRLPPDDRTKVSKAAAAFRRGKERILREVTKLLRTTHGGPEATLITDPDQRRRFMLLCRAKHELSRLARQQFASDRRARVSEQARVRRECLYYFQTLNGTHRPVQTQFILR